MTASGTFEICYLPYECPLIGAAPEQRTLFDVIDEFEKGQQPICWPPLASALVRLVRSLLSCSGSRNFFLETHAAGQADLEEVAHEAQEVDIAGGELRSGTCGLDPLSCRLCRTTRTMSEYRSLGQSAGLLSLPAWPDTP